MAMFHEIRKLSQAPIEDVLQRLYPVTLFKWLYDVNLRSLAETNPQELPQPDPSTASQAVKTPKKDYLVQLLLRVLQDRAIGHRFVETLPDATREVIAALAWSKSENLACLETRLGRQIAMANPDERRTYYEPFLVPPEHAFLVIVKNEENGWSSFYGREQPKKENYSVLLPDTIRKAFKALVPPPPGYELRPIDHEPSVSLVRYSCSDKLIADLRLVAEYIAQGHLHYTKSERVAMPSLKTLHQMTGSSEFFETTDDPGLAMLRTRLLVGGVAFAGDKEREKLLATPDSAGPVRRLIEKVLAHASFLHEELLSHLTKSRNGGCTYNPQSVAHLASFFGTLPAEKWVSWENIRSYHTLREDRPTLFRANTDGLQAHASKRDDRWSTTLYVSERNELELVSEPLLKGFAFLLAAFGVAEIAYASPTHSVYCRPKKTYLSPFDGLACVRLTSLGEFVFRRRDDYEILGAAPTRSPILLDEARLLATCRNVDPLTELALGQFMELLTPGRYRMTAKSLLCGCGSLGDIEERIRLFRRVVSAKPPANWEAFFERVLARIAPLRLEPEYLVMKVGADEEIRSLLTSDPVLREIVLKVEGLRIAVRRSDLKKLAKRLEEFGYLSPVPRVS